VSASVSASGEVFAVGAPDQDGSGAAYVFRRSGSSWIEEAVVEAPRAGEADRFGDSVSIAGDTLAVGASEEDSAATGIDGEEDDNQAGESGAVYVFQRGGSAWVQDAYVKASNTGAGDVFGASVSLSGDILAVGAYGEDSGAAGAGGDETDDSAPDSGAVYVFQRGAESWAQVAYLKASSPGASDHFGWSVATSGSILVAGAPYEDSAAAGIDGDQRSDSTPDSGAAYVFHRAGDSWYQKAYVKADSPSIDASLGTSLSAADDALAVGAPCEADAAMAGGHCTGRGAVYLFQ
jgi:trimeric autotransporter adhesin